MLRGGRAALPEDVHEVLELAANVAHDEHVAEDLGDRVLPQELLLGALEQLHQRLLLEPGMLREQTPRSFLASLMSMSSSSACS